MNRLFYSVSELTPHTLKVATFKVGFDYYYGYHRDNPPYFFSQVIDGGNKNLDPRTRNISSKSTENTTVLDKNLEE